jgi:hypothetical protein
MDVSKVFAGEITWANLARWVREAEAGNSDVAEVLRRRRRGNRWEGGAEAEAALLVVTAVLKKYGSALEGALRELSETWSNAAAAG